MQKATEVFEDLVGDEPVTPGRNRAYRRHQNGRIKNKRQFYSAVRNYEESEVRKRGRALKSPAMCQCDLCSNPRKYGQLTIQERRLHQLFHEPIETEPFFEGD